MAVLCGMPIIQYSARSARLSLLLSYLHPAFPVVSRDCCRIVPCRACASPASEVSEIFWNTFRVRTVLARGMTLN